MKFRKKPVVIEASQWLKNGDHPLDYEGYAGNYASTGAFASEGLIVRYFRHPDVGDAAMCKYCGGMMHDHGWIDTQEGGHIVCPGDWVITGVAGEMYPCKPGIFEQTYEPVVEKGDE